MQHEAWSWNTSGFAATARLTRWGHFGTPVLLFPSAGGDCLEVERFGLIDVLEELLRAGRIKIYSIEGLAVRAWLSGKAEASRCRSLQERFDRFVCDEVVPRIRADCQEPALDPVLAGVSWGAFYALSAICSHPGMFRAAIGISGSYDLTGHLSQRPVRKAAFVAEAALTRLRPAELERLRSRTLMLGSGSGDYERPDDSQRLAAALESQGVQCELRLWGPDYRHDWASWREKLPQFIARIA